MEIMTTDVRVASPGEGAEVAFQRMRNQRIRHLVVVDGHRLVGVLSERDLGGARGGVLRAGKTVRDLMSRHTVSAAPVTTVRQAANLMRARTIGCLPVMESGRLVGIVTLTDLLELVGRQAQLSPSVISRYRPKYASRARKIRRLPVTERPPRF